MMGKRIGDHVIEQAKLWNNDIKIKKKFHFLHKKRLENHRAKTQASSRRMDTSRGQHRKVKNKNEESRKPWKNKTPNFFFSFSWLAEEIVDCGLSTVLPFPVDC